jgi:hypothetical protein
MNERAPRWQPTTTDPPDPDPDYVSGAQRELERLAVANFATKAAILRKAE